MGVKGDYNIVNDKEEGGDKLWREEILYFRCLCNLVKIRKLMLYIRFFSSELGMFVYSLFGVELVSNLEI